MKEELTTKKALHMVETNKSFTVKERQKWLSIVIMYMLHKKEINSGVEAYIQYQFSCSVMRHNGLEPPQFDAEFMVDIFSDPGKYREYK